MRKVWVGMLVAAAIIWGAWLRAWGVAQRPFWADEAWVADTLTLQSPSQLLLQRELPLAPFFSLAAKTFGSVVTPPELGLRLVPLVCGVVLLPVLYLVARSLRLPRSISIMALFLGASSLMLLLWSRELKQYEVEALMVALTALLVFRLRHPSTRTSATLLKATLAVLCAVGPWCGYSYVFGAAALLPLLLLRRSDRRGLNTRVWGVIAMTVLGASTFILYAVVASGQAGHPALRAHLSLWFLDPGAAKSWLRAGAYAAMSWAMVFFPLEWIARQLVLIAIAGAAVLLLVVVGIRSWPRRTRLDIAWWTFAPWIVMLAASAARLYPFSIPRMMVFTAPPIVLAAAAGLAALCRSVSVALCGKQSPGLIAGLVFAGLPSIYAINVPLRNAYWVWHDFPSVVDALRDRVEPGEVVIVGIDAAASVHYYARGWDSGFIYFPVTLGTMPIPGYDYDAFAAEALDRAGDRFWFLCTGGTQVTAAKRFAKKLQEQGYESRLVVQGREYGHEGGPRLFQVTRLRK